MEKIKQFFRKTKRSYRALPDKKQYIEFFTAALTVPVLITVIIINLNNLKTNKTPSPQPQSSERPIVVNVPDSKGNNTVIQQPSNAACIKGIGPVSIDYPEESDIVNDNPIQIDINYEQGDYCAVVWSYKINDGKFSEYDDKSIALYNVPNGSIRFQLRVKSIVTGETKLLTRNFTYNGTSITPTASESAKP